jgi:hypothetical protein
VFEGLCFVCWEMPRVNKRIIVNGFYLNKHMCNPSLNSSGWDLKESMYDERFRDVVSTQESCVRVACLARSSSRHLNRVGL